MKSFHRALNIPISLLLPAVYITTAVFFIVGAISLGTNDRAIVWVEGDPGHMESISLHLQDRRLLANAAVHRSGGERKVPDSCSADAYELSIGGLRAEEHQAAREVLESIAAQHGAKICRTNIFAINEPHDFSHSSTSAYLSSALLQSMLLPCGMVLVVFWAFSSQLSLTLRNTGPFPTSRQIGIGVLGGLASLLAVKVVALAGWLLGAELPDTRAVPLHAVNAALVFALVFAEPFLEELAFRTWMISLAERAIGTIQGAVFSTAVFVAVHVPASITDGITLILLGAIYAGIYVKTRSLLACVLANGLCSAMIFVGTGG